MVRLSFRLVSGSAAVIAAALLAGPAATQQQPGPPTARYTMDAGTVSGLGAMGAGGGMEAAMAMMTGGGAGYTHELLLKLGSSRSPAGAPEGDHFMPAGAGLGTSVPLVTPVPGKWEGTATDAELPKFRLLIYWGCGEHAGPGQPMVIDFSKLAKGEIPQGLYADGLNIPEEWRVSPSNSTTYGDWPNGTDTKQVGSKASLLGDHKITSTYAPDISFKLDHDFMAPLKTRSSGLPGGAWSVSWDALPDATGYYAWVMSAKTDKKGNATDMVWWASSATRQFGGPMWDWLSPGAVAQLVQAQTVMPPGQTSCTVPAEVSAAGGEMLMANLYAYGPERNFSYPPRPAKLPAGWQPDWIARVRFRSHAMFALGMDDMLAGMDSGADDASAPDAQPPAKKPKCKGLKGLAMRAAGLCE